MLFDARLPKSFWAECVSTANLSRNVIPSRVVKCTPYELFFGKKPDVSMLRVFGSQALFMCQKKNVASWTCVVYVEFLLDMSLAARAGVCCIAIWTAWRPAVSRDLIFNESTLGDAGSNA
jgi:hypothetical protein